MKTNLLILLVLAAAAFLYTAGSDHGWFDSRQPDTAPTARPEIGKMVPDFSFTAKDGKTYTLADFKGRGILIHFWASWCAPCVTEFPELIEYARKNRLTVIALSLDTTDGAMDRFLKRLKRPLPETIYIARDADKHIAENLYGTFRLPETYLVGPDLVLKEKIAGAKNW